MGRCQPLSDLFRLRTARDFFWREPYAKVRSASVPRLPSAGGHGVVPIGQRRRSEASRAWHNWKSAICTARHGQLLTSKRWRHCGHSLAGERVRGLLTKVRPVAL